MAILCFDLVAERVSRAVALSKRGKLIMVSGMLITIIFLPTVFGIGGSSQELSMPSPMSHPSQRGLQVGLFEHSMEGPTRDTLPDNEALVQHTLGAGCTENMQDHHFYQYKYLYKNISDTEPYLPNTPVPGPVPTGPGQPNSNFPGTISAHRT